MMYKRMMVLLASGVFALFSANASALLMAQVGTLDDIVASTDLGNSSLESETQWVADQIAGGDTSAITYTKLSGSDGSAWEAVTDDGLDSYGFDFGSENPDFFLVKTGNLVPGPPQGQPDTWLFLNNDTKQFGYVDLGEIISELINQGFAAGDLSVNIGKFSHTGITGGEDVPEPGTLGLLGLGLLGLAFRQRMLRRA